MCPVRADKSTKPTNKSTVGQMNKEKRSISWPFHSYNCSNNTILWSAPRSAFLFFRYKFSVVLVKLNGQPTGQSNRSIEIIRSSLSQLTFRPDRSIADFVEEKTVSRPSSRESLVQLKESSKWPKLFRKRDRDEFISNDKRPSNVRPTLLRSKKPSSFDPTRVQTAIRLFFIRRRTVILWSNIWTRLALRPKLEWVKRDLNRRSSTTNNHRTRTPTRKTTVWFFIASRIDVSVQLVYFLSECFSFIDKKINLDLIGSTETALFTEHRSSPTSTNTTQRRTSRPRLSEPASSKNSSWQRKQFVKLDSTRSDLWFCFSGEWRVIRPTIFTPATNQTKVPRRSQSLRQIWSSTERETRESTTSSHSNPEVCSS